MKHEHISINEDQCMHEWKPCHGNICTSDLHNVHCSKCGRHAMFSMAQIDGKTWYGKDGKIHPFNGK